MDYNKIGEFISFERKAKKLTQAKLAEKLFVSEKTISKWENGNGIPDTSVLPKLCEIFEISINELLNGERIPAENYTNKAEENLLNLQKQKEEYSKILLLLEWVVGLMAITAFFVPLFVSVYLIELYNLVVVPIILISVGFVIFFVGMGFGLWIEQKAGYYMCKHCNHKHVPTYSQVTWAMHIGRTRYLKCPKCGKKSWNKKVIK